jgi:hypothetical protein
VSARWRGRLSRAVFEDRSIDVDELLFNKYDIYSVVENQKLETRKAVDALKPNDVLTTSEDDLVQDLVANPCCGGRRDESRRPARHQATVS